MRYIKLENKYLSAVAKMHQQELIYSFTSLLGQKFLEKFYKTFLLDNKSFAYVALSNENDLAGFIAITLDIKNFKKIFIRQINFKIILICLKKISFKAIKSIFQNITDSNKSPITNVPEIISLATSKNFRKMGIGKELINISCSHLKKMNISRISVSVGDKLEANSFYQKIGFKKTHYINYNSKKMNANIYVKDIN